MTRTSIKLGNERRGTNDLRFPVDLAGIWSDSCCSSLCARVRQGNRLRWLWSRTDVRKGHRLAVARVRAREVLAGNGEVLVRGHRQALLQERKMDWKLGVPGQVTPLLQLVVVASVVQVRSG